MGWVGVGVSVSGELVVAASASVSVVGRTGAVSGIIRADGLFLAKTGRNLVKTTKSALKRQIATGKMPIGKLGMPDSSEYSEFAELVEKCAGDLIHCGRSALGPVTPGRRVCLHRCYHAQEAKGGEPKGKVPHRYRAPGTQPSHHPDTPARDYGTEVK